MQLLRRWFSTFSLVSLLLVAAPPLALADITITSPAAGTTLTGGGAIEVAWANTGTPAFTTYTLSLCAGGNTDGTWISLTDLVTGASFATGNQAQAVINSGLGASTPLNAYFLRLIATSATGSVTYYSSRFSITGMLGTFPANVLAGANTVTGTTGPATVDQEAPANVDPGTPQFTVQFADQIGLTRWAPMQSVPPTKITKKNPTPLYPTSSITGYAKTFLPIPTVQTTITQAQTFAPQPKENTAAPMPQPSDDMAKFLNRWKD